METIYDWVTVAIFAGLIVLFLTRSTAEEQPREHDSLLLYFGDQGPLMKTAFLGAGLFYAGWFIRPARQR